MTKPDSEDHQARVDALFREVLDMDTLGARAYLAISDETAEIKDQVVNLLDDDDAATVFMASRAAAEVMLEDYGSAAEEGADALLRGVTVGRYVILDTLGSGGMGVVYSAYDPELDRKIAIKLLRSDRVGSVSGSDGQVRLMREARALAKVSHAHVLPIFDVGRFQDQVFLAMEYVQGKDLRGWLDESSRPWREVLAHFIAAGQGLAAAHSADVIHRDFKPQNVMVGDDGQVRVMDFGLARSLSGETCVEEYATQIEPTVDPLTSNLTHAGFLLGTPAYMSPEQLIGETLGAESDQFSFAVSLYHALFDVRPFAARTPHDLLIQIKASNVVTPGSSTAAPAWLRRALLKALQYDPGQRYASMGDLLDILQRDPIQRRNRWLGSAGLLLLIFTASGFYFDTQQRQNTICKGAGAKMAAVWNPGRKAEIEAAFLTTNLAYAADTWATVERQFDQYANQWIGTHTQACEATHVQGEQSASLLDLRMTCLEGRRQELSALATVFSEASTDVVSRAAKASGAMSPIDHCSDTATLTARVPLPSDPAKRRMVSEIEGVLASTKAFHNTGQYEKSEIMAKEALEKAKTIGYMPAMAQASFRAAEALKRKVDVTGAQGFYQDSFSQAIAGADDRQAARAAAAMVEVSGLLLERPEDSTAWEGHARAFLARIGGDRLIEAELLANLGSIAQQQGHYEDAFLYAERVLELRIQVFGAEHERVGAAMVNLSNAMRTYTIPNEDSGKIIELLRQAHEILRKRLGAAHPLNSIVLSNLGGALVEVGRTQEAYEANIQAVAIARESFGEYHFDTGVALNNLAAVEVVMHRNEAAITHLKAAIGIIEAELGADHSYLIGPITGMVVNSIVLGRYDVAERFLKRGLSMIAGKEGQEYALSVFRLAEAKIAFFRDSNRQKARLLGKEAMQLARRVGPRASEHKLNIQEFIDELQVSRPAEEADLQNPTP